jgi:hypothetical protein
MTTVKEDAKKLIDILPDDATWDDVMYEMFVRQKIELGLKAVEEGRVMSLEDAKKRLHSK